MKTEGNSIVLPLVQSFGRVIWVGAVLFVASSIPAQNLFVGDQSNIYEYTPSGVQSTFASGLAFPTGLAFDGVGDLFAADSSGTIYKFTPGGVQTTFASGLSDPYGLAFNSSGDLFEADYGSGTIYKFTPDGVRSTFASGLTGLYAPSTLAFNSSGVLFAAANYVIFEFTPDGALSFFLPGLGKPSGLAFDSAGDLFESDFSSGNIYKFTPGGVRSTFASGMYPGQLAFDSTGNLFEVSGDRHIYEYTPGGVRSTFASGLDFPYFLAFQPVPEPSALGLLTVGVTALIIRRRCLAPERERVGS
jgi:DNA-binding beta-propeller fold protein YncE